MSTIIIRLQNLPLSAKAADIREFFGDLKIPKGSVNIVGGPQGDAFIGFSTDEDARLAMLLDGRLLHNSKIHLMLSSKREMQDVIASAQAQAQGIKTGHPENTNNQLNGPTKTEPIAPKAEVLASPPIAESSPTSQIQPPYYGTSQPPSHPTNFPQTQMVQSLNTFGGDSWKNPQSQQQQQQNPPTLAPPPNIPSGTQQTPQSQQMPVFPTSMAPSQFAMPPPQISQHQYQQIPPQQLPGFPPPIGQQPPNIGGQFQPQIPMGGFQQPPPNLPRPPFLNPPPQQNQQPAGMGNNDKFFNQVHPRFPPSQIGGNGQSGGLQQQFPVRGSGPQGQQQFGGRPTGPPGMHGNFRPNNQQQQFGRRTPNQSFSPQRPPPQSFGAQQRPTGGNFRPQFGQQQQRFGGPQQQQFGGIKRPRSRSPDQGQNKRFNMPNKNVGYAGYGQKQQGNYSQQQRQEKPRICVQLSNVPYKATYKDIQDYLSTIKVKCIKCTRVYMPDKNFSDRWIVEFDNEENAREVCRYQGEIAGRTIRAERIPPRRADEQYAVMEPETKDKDENGDRRSRRDRDGRRGSRERSRDRNRSRSAGNRDRSRGRNRPSSREKEKQQNRERSRERSKSRGRKRSKSPGEGGRTKSAERSGNRQRRLSPIKEDSKHSNEPSLNATNQPIPLSASFGGGTFSFPGAPSNQDTFNANSGGAVQLGSTDGMKPIPLRETAQFFPSAAVRPPPLVNTLNGSNGNGQSTTLPSQSEEHQQMNFNNFWSVKKSATGANAMPLGPRLNASNGSLNTSPTFNYSAGELDNSSTGSTVGPALVIDTGGEEEMDDSNEDIKPPQSQKEILHNQKITNPIFGPSSTVNFKTITSIPDQPPLDLLEPEIDYQNGAPRMPLFSSSSSNTIANSNLPSIPQMPNNPTQRRSFDSKPILPPNIGSHEFSQQEVELRPHLHFLDNYKLQDPNLKSCIRLENVPKMVFVDQLSDFLGTKISMPSQNIARMFNGVLYINLDNELFAIKAASKNGQFLAGSQIGITQLKKCEMADAIRQNMIIIREMYRVTVVVRGFPLNAQQNEVISLFERFNVNKEAVEKCAVRNTDTKSAFILTFPTIQDCQNAVLALNGVQIGGGNRLEVFQPEKLTI